MTNGMSPRIRHIVSSLAAVATTALLLSAVVESFDPRLLTGPGAADAANAVVAAARRPLLISKV
jgi:hypothetical protein